MSLAAINRLIQLFADAFEQLGQPVEMPRAEQLAMLVQRSMDHRRRVYHSSQHLFAMVPGMNARQTLATLFHDLVYYQLDGGFPTLLDHELRRVARVDNGQLSLRLIDRNDWQLRLCAEVFGFAGGQTLSPYAGQNEFLSAVAAVRLLHDELPPRELLAIVACIEATIPFRGPDAHGRELSERLWLRLRQSNRDFACGADEGELERMVADAIDMANRDVAGFAEPDPAQFLANTWLLIEESNAPQVESGVYSIRDYRQALARMEGFLRTLKPEYIFHRDGVRPEAGEYAAQVQAAGRNLDFACAYLGCKLLSISIVEAFAQLTGGDCPISMLLGDLRGSDGPPLRAEDLLPELPAAADLNPGLLRVLQHGRARESQNDLTASPLSAYVYAALGDAASRRILVAAREMFAGTLTPQDFLAHIPAPLVDHLGQACAQISPSRRELLRHWLATRHSNG
ncbi:hypothetical protein VX159_02260 [Dechloromonas sp. ZY10]|uniref:hypothetical protein n=1 Tax=Dechloromonas aquae TaxID=2664436 RepID=UPI003528B05A